MLTCGVIITSGGLRLLVYALIWAFIQICTHFYCWLTLLLLKGIPYRYFVSQFGDAVNRLERLFMV